MDKHYREPVKHTCPDIDNLIKGQNDIMKLIRNYHKIDDIDVLKDILNDIESILYDFEKQLEKLRSSNNELRTWGILEAEKVDELEDYISELENQSNHL